MQNQVNSQTNEVSNGTSTKTLSEKAKQLREAFNVNDEEAQILADEIDRADVNKDGTITTDEMTPTLDRFTKKGNSNHLLVVQLAKHLTLNIQQKMLDICLMMNF